MPRFVLLEHDHPALHYDLMLEFGDILRTWRLFDYPRSGESVVAEPSFDHRPLYLEYEGPISGDRGSVVRRARGEYIIQSESPSELIASMAGGELNGIARIWQEADGRWRFQINGTAPT